jgi:hypothetical protein
MRDLFHRTYLHVDLKNKQKKIKNKQTNKQKKKIYFVVLSLDRWGESFLYTGAG